MEKLIYLDSYMNTSCINEDLKIGWIVKSITPLHISTATAGMAKGGALVVLVKTELTLT